MLLIVLKVLQGTIMLLDPMLENNTSDNDLVKKIGIMLYAYNLYTYINMFKFKATKVRNVRICYIMYTMYIYIYNSVHNIYT